MKRVQKGFAVALTFVILLVLSLANTAQVAFAEATKTITLAVVGDAERAVMLCPKEVAVQEGETVLDILKREFPEGIVTKSSSWGEYLVGIDGLVAEQKDPRSYWTLEVNDASANVGVSGYYVQDGDKIALRYVADWNISLNDQTLEQSIAQLGGCETPKKEVSITLAVVGDAERKVMVCPKELVAQEGETVLDVLKREFPDGIVTKSSSWGEYLVGIDGLIAEQKDPRSYWTLEVNDASANVGVSGYDVQDGDKIALRYVADWNIGLNDQTLEQSIAQFGSCEEQNEGSPANPDSGTPTTSPNPEEIEKETTTAVNVDATIQSTAQFILNKGLESDWEVIGLVQAGVAISEEKKAAYLEQLKERVTTSARLNNMNLARTILAIEALEEDPTSFVGQNLIAKLYNDSTVASINSYIYTLIALDSKDYKIPADAKWTRETLLAEILKLQLADGGWSFSGTTADPDMTGMALTALAPHQNQPEVAAAIQKAVNVLSDIQTENGGYTSGGQENANSAAQVIMGLSAVGVNPAGEAFTKSGHSLLQNVQSFQLADGSFKWLSEGAEFSALATEQVFYALVQYQFYTEGKGSIFHWTNTAVPVDNKTNVETVTQTAQAPATTEAANVTATTASVAQTTASSTSTANQTLPETAMFGQETVATTAAGLICITAGAILWRRKRAA